MIIKDILGKKHLEHENQGKKKNRKQSQSKEGNNQIDRMSVFWHFIINKLSKLLMMMMMMMAWRYFNVPFSSKQTKPTTTTTTTMVDRIFAVNRKAVLSFFNFFKNDHQFIANYCNTIAKLGAKDQYSIKCFRTIYFLLISQAIFQVYLYLCPLQWQQSMVFNIFDQSNNYPNTLKLSTSTIFLMSAYLFYMLHFPIRSERCFELAREWYLNENQTFTKIPALKIKKIIVAILDGYQVFVIIARKYYELNNY